MTHFPNLNLLSLSILRVMMKCHRSNPAAAFDQILSLTSHPAAVLSVITGSAEQTLPENLRHAGTVLFTFFVSLLFQHPTRLSRKPSPLSSPFLILSFCFSLLMKR